MKRGYGSFLEKHRASLLGAAAIAALILILSTQVGFNLSADGLGANQTLEIVRGKSLNLSLTISGGIGFMMLSATPIGKIHLNAIEVPAGLNVSFDPNEGCPLFHSNATIRADDNAAEGRKKIVFRGVGPLGEAKRMEIGIQIVSTRFFKLVGGSAEFAIKQNKTGTVPVNIIRNPDYAQPITFKAIDLPAGIVPAFDPSGSLPGAVQTTLLLKINPETRIGRYNFSVMGTGADGRTAYCNFSLEIEADRYFTISANPPIIRIGKGNDSVLSLELTGVNNYTGKIKLSVAKYPRDIVRAEIEEPVGDLSAYSIMDRSNIRLYVSTGATPGASYYVVVNGLGEDGYSANGSIMVIVEGQKGSFKIKPQLASLQLKPGESKNSDIIIEGKNGYEGTIILSASELPGITANLVPNEVHLDSRNSVASSRLSLVAQADGDNNAKSDMIISASDASQNSDDCRIAISIEVPPAATEQSAIKTQVAEPQSVAVPANNEPPAEQAPANEPEIIAQPEPDIKQPKPDQSEAIQPVIQPAISPVTPPENAMPYLESIISGTEQIYSDQIATFAAEAEDPENDPIYYRFLHNGRIARDWSDKNSAEILMTEGENKIEVQVIDGLHNGNENYDDNKFIKIMANAKIEALPTYENTSREQFFDLISANEFNYNNIPIESISAAPRDKWYRSDPDSANYVGEYEIRKELFYSKSDYTIKLVLDNQSRPIEVIFMKDSNIVSEVPSGFVKQAMRKLSNL
ncbi:MAG: hypothetical protein A4E49_02394 [Methanosaeta sp. PtaU1.Bin112]|nr:MAG: hypothetical protein A4E49_02394 [Methanosaeta sp. PtaU1.Bin112]